MNGYVHTLGCRLIGSAGWFQATALLAVRLWIAEIFFMSGLTKIKSWATTISLFEDEYKVQLLSPEVVATNRLHNQAIVLQKVLRRNS